MTRGFFFLYILIFCCCSSHTDNALQLAYSIHLQNVDKLQSAKKLYSNKEYENAIEMYSKIECQDLMCLTKNIGFAKSYMQLNEIENAELFMDISITQGFNIEYLDSVLFSTLIDHINYHKDSLQGVYSGNIDVSLRKQLYDMVKLDQRVRNYSLPDSIIEETDKINLFKLDSIVEKIGWPSLNVIGHPTPTEWINPSIIIIHSPVRVNWKYLDIILEECIKGNEKWFVAEEVFNNILFRHSNEVNPIPIPYFRYDEEGLDIYNSQFILNTIAQALVRNKKFRIVFKVSTTNSTCKNPITEYLYDLGVKKDQVLFLNPENENATDELKIFGYVEKVHHNSF